MWSLHISELTWRDLFSLFIPWVCKREKKLPFDDFLLFWLLLWWDEIKKKKKSLKFEGKVCRLFSDKQMFLKWWRHRENHGGHKHEVAEQTKSPSPSDSLAAFLWNTPVPGHAFLHWAARLPIGKEDREWGIVKEPFIQPVIMYASIIVGCLN